MNRYGLLGLMGAGAGALAAPYDAEAKAVDKFYEDFLALCQKALKTGKDVNMYGGELEDAAFKTVPRRLPQKRANGEPVPPVQNGFIVSTHGPRMRYLLDNVPLEDSVRHYENMLNSEYTRATPNFPAQSKENAAWRKGDAILYNNDGSPYVFPFRVRDDGKMVSTTAMKPKGWKKPWIENYMRSVYPDVAGKVYTPGRPASAPSISETQTNKPVGTQLPGFSAVGGKPSVNPNLSNSGPDVNKKAIIPPLVAGSILQPGNAEGTVSPGNPYKLQPQNSYGRQLGLGARSVLEGIGDAPHTLLNRPINGVFGTNLRNPGEGLADYFGLPKPRAGTDEETRANIQQGLSTAMGDVMTGRTLMKAPGYLGKFGSWLASSPMVQAASGGILGMMTPGGASAQNRIEPDDTYGDGVLWHMGLRN